MFLPWALTPLFIVFLLMAMPLRIYDYGWRHQGFNFFYLFDFCYWVNAAVGLVLLAPRPETLRGPLAAVYCLADGPVAAALLAWQCRWTVTSAEHTTRCAGRERPRCRQLEGRPRFPAARGVASLPAHRLQGKVLHRRELSLDALRAVDDDPKTRTRSTLMHLLPGLATFAAWHLAPTGASTWPEYLGLPGRGVGAGLLDATPARQALWRLAAPLAFYAAWQVQYYAVVHVCCEGHIQRNGCDTSYRCLARRAKRAGNGLARLVLRGSTNRRIAVYGARVWPCWIRVLRGGGCLGGVEAGGPPRRLTLAAGECQERASQTSAAAAISKHSASPPQTLFSPSMPGLLQAAFTVVTVLLVQPMLHSFWLAAAWQVAKVVIPLRAARRYRLAMRRRLAAQDRQRDGGDQSPVRLAAAAS